MFWLWVREREDTMNMPHSGTPHVGQIRGQQVLTTMSYLCIWMKKWKLDLINNSLVVSWPPSL